MRADAKTDGGIERSCFALIVIGLGLRFYRLGEPLGPLEIIGVGTAKRGLLDMARFLVSTESDAAEPPLFHILMHGWMRLCGDSNAALHALTAGIGSLGVLAALWAGTKMAGRRAGLLAAAVMALHPFSVSYSQEIRSYCLLVLLGTLSFGFLHEAVRTDDWKSWAGFLLSSLAALYTQNYAPLLTAAQTAWLAWSVLRQGRALSKRMILCYALLAAGYLPWVPGVLAQVRAKNLSREELSLTPAFYALSGLSVNVEHLWVSWPRGGAEGLLAVSFGLALLAARGLWAEKRDLLVLLAGCGAACVALPFALSLLISPDKPFYWSGRHSIIALPAVCLFWGAGLESIKSTRLRNASLAACLLLFSYPLRAYFTQPKSPFNEIALYARSQLKPDYVLLILPHRVKAFIVHFYPPALSARRDLGDLEGPRLPPGVVCIMITDPNPAKGRLPASDWSVLKARYRLTDKRIFRGLENRYFAIVATYVRIAN